MWDACRMLGRCFMRTVMREAAGCITTAGSPERYQGPAGRHDGRAECVCAPLGIEKMPRRLHADRWY